MVQKSWNFFHNLPYPVLNNSHVQYFAKHSLHHHQNICATKLRPNWTVFTIMVISWVLFIQMRWNLSWYFLDSYRNNFVEGSFARFWSQHFHFWRASCWTEMKPYWKFSSLWTSCHFLHHIKFKNLQTIINHILTWLYMN